MLLVFRAGKHQTQVEKSRYRNSRNISSTRFFMTPFEGMSLRCGESNSICLEMPRGALPRCLKARPKERQAQEEASEEEDDESNESNYEKTRKECSVNTFGMDWFPKEVFPKPSGYYAHIILLRVTESYALFQTDGELNTARVRAGAGAEAKEIMTRIEIFKRKQTTPERLTGRELLRHHSFLSAEPSVDRKVRKMLRACPFATTTKRSA